MSEGADPSEPDNAGPQGASKAIPWKWLLLGIVIVSLYIASRQLPISDWLEAFNAWVAGLGFAGIVVYAAFYILATVLFLPSALVTLGAGFLFGLLWGTILVSFSATVGGGLAFLISRYIARDWVVSRAGQNPKFRAIDRAVGEQGGKIIFLLRLSPAIPFNLSNYLYGLTGVRFIPYLLASWLGTLPGTIMYVYLGVISKAGIQAASGATETQTTAQQGLLIVGLVATIAVTIFVTRVARNALKQAEVEEGKGS